MNLTHYSLSLYVYPPGCCNVVVGHPMDLIKVRQQTSSLATTLRAAQRSSSTLSMLRNIMQREGVKGLYSGITAPLVAVVPAFAITFWSYDLAKTVQLKQMLSADSPNKELSLGQIAAAGAFSGIPLAVVVGPLERFKCLMQVDKGKYSGFGDCVRQVYRQGGLRSVFRGTGLTVMRDVPGNASYFCAYEFWRRKLTANQQNNSTAPTMTTIMLAGGMAGVCNWIVAIPFDVLKSRWQTAAPGTYTNLAHVLRSLLEKEGPTSLFRGLSPALLRAFPANAACLLGVETARTILPVAFPSSSVV